MGGKWIPVTFCAIWLCLLPPIGAAGQTEIKDAPYAAIVIDDFGSDMEGTEEMMNLPFTITVAVMPFLPSTKRDAEWAHRKGHQVIVHLPMEPMRGRKEWLGPGAITCDLTDEEIRKRVNAAIDNVPHAVGMNNHMGSKATVDERVMHIILEVCRERGIMFLDSHTNYRSVVAKIAKEVGVPCIENHIFLDDVRNANHISKQIKLLQRHLSEHDKCVAIGHVGTRGRMTAGVIRQAQTLASNIRFVGITDMLKQDKLVTEIAE
jgi:polysaccharide deacetylase 2 family uncharacterized protein YibQ